MSGFHPLSPGLRLMRRLRLRGKLLLLAAAAVVPLLLAWALQHWKRHLPGVAAPAGPTLKVLNTVAIGPQQRLL